uniref:large ribosomal subunit protein bL33m n=1 Tax=Myxine glutinosa TaxID=7769 RepID=UPI00358E80F8
MIGFPRNLQFPVPCVPVDAQRTMLLTAVNLAKSKSKAILVQMVSGAGTGHSFNVRRSRLRDKLVIRKHDPFVNRHVLFHEKKKVRSI